MYVCVCVCADEAELNLFAGKDKGTLGVASNVIGASIIAMFMVSLQYCGWLPNPGKKKDKEEDKKDEEEAEEIEDGLSEDVKAILKRSSGKSKLLL